MSSTGDFQPSIAPIVDERYDTLSGSIEPPHRCTPAMSTPTLKRSELRASACDVRTPPYDSPQIPMRFGSTSGRVFRYSPPARTSWYSALPRPPVFGAVRNDLP